MMDPTQADRDRQSKPEPEPPARPLDLWVENWRKANEAFVESLRSGGIGEQATKQAKEFRKTLENGLKDLQKLWQSAGESMRK